MSAKIEKRLPGQEEIKIGRVPGGVLATTEQVTAERKVYKSQDEKHRLVDIIETGINARSLTLQVRTRIPSEWTSVMRVREVLSPKGKKVKRQDLWISGLAPNGRTSLNYIDDHGKMHDVGMYSFADASDVKQLIQMGVYAESKLPQRIDRVATMNNFFEVVRSGTMTKPKIVPYS